MICGRSVVPFGHICSPRGTAKGKQLSKARPPGHVWRNASENPEKQTLQILQNRAPVYTGAPFSLRRHVPEMLPKQHPFELVMDAQGIHFQLHGPFRGGYALWSNEATAQRLSRRPWGTPAGEGTLWEERAGTSALHPGLHLYRDISYINPA